MINVHFSGFCVLVRRRKINRVQEYTQCNITRTHHDCSVLANFTDKNIRKSLINLREGQCLVDLGEGLQNIRVNSNQAGVLILTLILPTSLLCSTFNLRSTNSNSCTIRSTRYVVIGNSNHSLTNSIGFQGK
jgi:hypothetical protein